VTVSHDASRLETPSAADRALHAAEIESLERRILDVALERTGARDGAIFLWDAKEKGLVIDFHVVDGLAVNIPGVIIRRRRDGRRNGIALWVHEHGEPYLCPDTREDPHYASYFQDVLSIAAAPIRYQKETIGVISVSAHRVAAFTRAHLDELEALAASSAKFLRRAQLYRATNDGSGRPFLIKGLSPEWLLVERQIEHVAPTDAPVLIHGESGTGKELTAHAIHFNSRRASGPFVAVNCAAIPDTLLESTLFGHVRGAFTGATSNRVGELERAHGGTLFLDEIGELPMALQPKLLRAMESGEVQPVGSDGKPKRVDVRIISATNRDLPEMVRRARFRDDLYYRVAVVSLELPPLRSYKDNLDVLAQVFAQQAAKRHRKPTARLSAAFRAKLATYDFPGNVRELKNAVEHAVIMSQSDELSPADLPRSFGDPRPRAAEPVDRPQTLEELREAVLDPAERAYLTEVLRVSGGNVREAARRAGVNTVTMYRLLKRRGLHLTRSVSPSHQG
jgi:transcriptional regulator with GAF, ATPase, and Fis domain